MIEWIKKRFWLLGVLIGIIVVAVVFYFVSISNNVIEELEDDNDNSMVVDSDEVDNSNDSDNEIYLAVGDTLNVGEYLGIETGQSVSFSVENQAILSIDDNGEILALSEGNTNLLITLADEVKTIKVIVASVESDLATLSSSTGLNRTYMTLIANSAAGNYRYFQLRYRGKIYSSNTWKSSNTSLVTVNNNGYVKVLKSPSVATNVVVSLTVGTTVYNCTIRVIPKAKILFIGNSMTYNDGNKKSAMVNNEQVQILKSYMSATNRNVSLTYSGYGINKTGYPVMGGRTLEQAYLDPTMKSTYVAGRQYDFIVLQEQTTKLFYSYLAANGTGDQKKNAQKQLKNLKKSIYNNRVDTDDVYTSYTKWLNYIYSNSNSMNAMTVVYIAPINTTNSLNSTCTSNGYKCNYTKDEVHKIQKNAFNDLVTRLEKYVSSNANMKGKVLFAPAAITWDKIRDENAYSLVSQLYTDDRHPDAYGQYIIASSLFYTISGANTSLTRTSNWVANYWPTYHKGGFTFGKNQINYIREKAIEDAKYYNFY